MSDTKTPLWKQLLGAVIGATVAFVLYQGYTVGSGYVQAALTFDSAGHARPTGTLDSPEIAQATWSSSAASSRSSENRLQLGPFGSLRGLKKFFQPIPSASSANSSAAITVTAPAVMAQAAASSSESWSSSSWSPPVEPVPVIAQDVSYPEPVFIPEEMPPQSDPVPEITAVAHTNGRLPQSGFGLDVLAVMAVGAVVGRKRAKRA